MFVFIGFSGMGALGNFGHALTANGANTKAKPDMGTMSDVKTSTAHKGFNPTRLYTRITG
jgi:hypothetical protein